MKVCYIIMPFRNAEYLIRCVNSLYRQLGKDYEVILAENELDEKSVQFLAEKPKVKRISCNAKTLVDKLAEAAKLVSKDSSYVQLLEVDSVVSPICAKAILACGNADLIVSAIAVRDGDEFDLDAPGAANLIKSICENPPQRFCFERVLFDEISAKNFEDFSAYMLFKCTKNISVATTDDVCMYVEPFGENFLTKSALPTTLLAEQISNIKNSIVRFSAANLLFDKLLYDINEEKFTALQTLCERCRGDILLNKTFEKKSGCGFDEFCEFNLDEYMLLCSENERILPENIMRKVDEIEKTIAEIKTEAGSIKSRAVMYEDQPAAVCIADPATEIPRMYYEGRLGLKTIWKSFCGWVKFKISRR